MENQPLPVDHCHPRGSRLPAGSLEPEGSTRRLFRTPQLRLMTHLDTPGTSGDVLSHCRKKDASTADNMRPRNPVKRRKERDDEENESVSSESTIIADDNDTGDLMDDNEDGFILVEHRRKRSTGVPVLLTPKDETCRLQQQNPLHLSSAISAAAGGKLLRHHFTARGGLRVEIAEEEAVRRLLKVKNLCGIEVQASVSATYLQNHGLIRGVPEWYSDAQLLDYLAPEGVIAVRRLFHRHGQPGAAAITTDKVLLTFRPNTERPSQVNLGFTRHDVVEHVVPPPRCFKCQAIGHVAKYCKGETKCKKCGGPHDITSCSKEVTVKCANCGDPHPASYVNCKVRLAALARTKAFLRGPKPQQQEVKFSAGPDDFPRLSPIEDASSETPTIFQPGKPRNNSRRKPKKPGGKSYRAALLDARPNDCGVIPSKETVTPAGSRTSTSGGTSGSTEESKVIKASPASTTLPEREDAAESPKMTIVKAVFATIRKVMEGLPAGEVKTALKGILCLEAILAL